MTNSFQLTFTLRQHTPIIHFQWHEKDASIRPTELKAKLDKWIIASMTGCYGNEDARLDKVKSKENEELKFPDLYKWLKGAKKADKTHPALNYSVRIKMLGTPSYFSPTIGDNGRPQDVLKTYFGSQMDPPDYQSGKKRIKKGVFAKGCIVAITSPYSDLITKIKEVFPEFILKTNFGTRQSKGFGSFFIEKDTEGFPSNYKDWFKGKFDWKFDVEVEGKGNNDAEKEIARIKDLFAKIDLFYKTLRSGISPQDKQLYFKSMMWKYTKSLSTPRQWDKKTIKQNWFSSIESSQQSIHTVSNPDEWPLHFTKGVKSKVGQGDKEIETHLLWRDLLGLSTNQSWRNPYNKDLVKSSQKKDEKNKPIYTRMQSPIMFKPIRISQNTFRIFFEVPAHIKSIFAEGNTKDSPAEILGEWFDFSAQGTTSFALPFPEKFDFDEFLSCAFSTNPNMWIEDGTYEKRVGANTFTEPHGKTRKVKNSMGKFEEVNNTDFECIVKIYSQLATQVKEVKKSKP